MFEFNAIEPEDYKERNWKSRKFNFIIALALFGFLALMRKWVAGLILFFIYLFIQNMRSSKEDRYFVTRIELSKERVYIRYKKESEALELLGSRSDFKFRKKRTMTDSGSPYLEIYFNGRLKIKQFEIVEWKEFVFDDIISLYSELA